MEKKNYKRIADSIFQFSRLRMMALSVTSRVYQSHTGWTLGGSRALSQRGAARPPKTARLHARESARRGRLVSITMRALARARGPGIIIAWKPLCPKSLCLRILHDCRATHRPTIQCQSLAIPYCKKDFDAQYGYYFKPNC